jgi:hypothetical protein
VILLHKKGDKMNVDKYKGLSVMDVMSSVAL